MINTKFFNFHDIIIITSIVIIWHVLAKSLYNKIDGVTASSDNN